jgi:hypothetical protein
MTCDECGNEIEGAGYEMGSSVFCGTACAMRHYRDRQAERIEYQRTTYRVPADRKPEPMGAAR